MRVTAVAIICATLWLPTVLAAEGAKLIKLGWDTRFQPTELAGQIDALQNTPFDGLSVPINALSPVFTRERADEAALAEQFAALEALQWGRFTDNFILLRSKSEMDWLSDPDWEAVVHNVRLLARAARIGGCRGICFDPEAAGPSPWHYPMQPGAPEHSFAEYEQAVRLRGAAFIDAIEGELDDPVVFALFLNGIGYNRAAALAANPSDRARLLSESRYGLLPAFINGMLDAVDEGTVIVDGNEGAYGYHSPQQFLDAAGYIRTGVLSLVASENHDAYARHVRVGAAVYVDELMGLRSLRTVADYMSAEERALGLEHNTWWALNTSDGYAWLFCERMNWITGEDLPPGAREAVESARAKVAAGEPLGFDFAPIYERARAELADHIENRIIRRTATVPRLTSPPPSIDGALDDAAWQAVEPLDYFVDMLNYRDNPDRVLTRCRATWDEDALYIAFDCPAPHMARMIVFGSRRDHELWSGEEVEVLISRNSERLPYARICANPEGLTWDGWYEGNRPNVAWDPEYALAVVKGEASWSAELAIPWAQLGADAPEPGERRFANFARVARWPGAREQTSWSQVFYKFPDDTRLGTLVFE